MTVTGKKFELKVDPSCAELAARAEDALEARRAIERFISKLPHASMSKLKMEGRVARLNAAIQMAVSEASEKGFFLCFAEGGRAFTMSPAPMTFGTEDDAGYLEQANVIMARYEESQAELARR